LQELAYLSSNPNQIITLSHPKPNGNTATHFPPSFPMRTPLCGAKLWIFGHHHGFAHLATADYQLIRNAVGYGNEPVDGHPARHDYVLEFEP
jgi:hypothetical protein